MADLLPNISVTLNQIKATSASVKVPINATVILKAKSGPIGELVKVSSYTEAVKIFGLGDATTPALYGIEQYLKTYNYVNIIRISDSDAAKGTISMKVVGEDPESPTALGELIAGTSVYKTDIYNGDEIQLVYNSTRTRLSLSGTLNGVTYTTPLELIDLSTATADVLEPVLNKLVKNWNALNTGMVLENKFIGKVDTDPTLAPTDIVKGTIQLGDSGNDGSISNNDVISLFTSIIEVPTLETQDVVLAPEFRNYEVVNAGTALKNAYFYLVACSGSTLAAKQEVIANYNPSDKGALYIPRFGLPSFWEALGDETTDYPVEVDANKRAFKYFSKYIDGFTTYDAEIDYWKSYWDFENDPISTDGSRNNARSGMSSWKEGLLRFKWYDFLANDPFGLINHNIVYQLMKY